MPHKSPALVFALGLATLGLGALAAWRWRPSRALHSPPLAADPDQPIGALVGELAAQDGGQWSARLVPLYADASRQAFEAVSLRQRLELPAGEPWRLLLRWDAGRQVHGAPQQPDSQRLGPVQVRDQQGTALQSIQGVASSAAHDPVRTLVGAPSGELRPGEAVDWVLWGRAPAAGAKLVGVLGDQLLFRAQTVRRSELSLPLARVDRRGDPAGKNGRDTASDEGDGESDEQRH